MTLTFRAQDELVPMFSYWQRANGAVDVVLGERYWELGLLYVDYTTYWPGDSRQGYGVANAERFASSRLRLAVAPEWTGVLRSHAVDQRVSQDAPVRPSQDRTTGFSCVLAPLRIHLRDNSGTE